MEMSLRLDTEFIDDYKDNSSDAYKELESQIVSEVRVFFNHCIHPRLLSFWYWYYWPCFFHSWGSCIAVLMDLSTSMLSDSGTKPSALLLWKIVLTQSKSQCWIFRVLTEQEASLQTLWSRHQKLMNRKWLTPTRTSQHRWSWLPPS